MESVGSRIKARRKELGLTLQVLAECIGVTRSAVSQWKNDGTNITAENFLKLSLALRTNPFNLIGVQGASIDRPEFDIPKLATALHILEPFLTRKKLHLEHNAKAKVLAYLSDAEGHAPDDEELLRLIELAR